MKRKHLEWIALGVTFSLVLPILGSTVSAVVFPDFRLEHLPIHSLVEAAGGLMAIGIAVILVTERTRKDQSGQYFWMASALIAMGLLDLFHAAVMPGKNFVWLHSTATFVGGLLFAFVWLPNRANRPATVAMPWVVLVATLLFGTASCLFVDYLPEMAVRDSDGTSFTFTPLAQMLNIGGGVFFLIAGAYFVRRHIRFDQHEDLLFAAHTVLFGAAGILFELSKLWDAAWWWWHILRMAAYLAALAFAIRAYLNAEKELFALNRELTDLNENLDRSVSERTSELDHERFLLHTLLDHLPDAIYFKDRDGSFSRVSRSLASRFGASPAEVVGKTDSDYFSRDYADQARADEVALMNGGPPLVNKEEHPQWTTGEESWVSTSKVVLKADDGEVLGTFGISHDVTALKQAEERIRRVIDAAPNPILLVDSTGRIRMVNAATGILFGYQREELVDQFVEVLLPERLREGHRISVQQFFKAPTLREGQDRELVGRRRDGSEIPLEVGLSPIEFTNELVCLAAVHDITTHKQARAALLEAKEAAEASNQIKSDFLANMSHEIRTPMNAVIGMTELLLDTDLDISQRDYLSTVLESAEQLMSIIDEILDFSKIEAGKLEIQEREFDLREEVGDVLKSLGLRAHGKQLELAWNVHTEVPKYVLGDPLRLRQMLINLVGNAIKFTDDGEVIVSVSQTSTFHREMMLKFSVKDTGIGVPKEKQAAIFAAFEQADTSTTRQYGGTGLGLAITSSFAQAMGGRIWVESEVDQGSTFHFQIVVKTCLSPPDEEPLPDLTQLPVLVVDDNATNRKILQQILESWGMSVTTAADADSAIEILREYSDRGDRLPLVLSDVHMPHMDGFMLTEKLRSLPGLREAIVIMLTSGRRAGDIARCDALGVRAHLMKPVKQSELLDSILLAVGETAEVQTVPAKPEELERDGIQPLNVLLAEDGKANQKLAVGLLTRWGHQVTVVENGLEAVNELSRNRYDLVLMDVQMPVMDGLEATRAIRRNEAVGARQPIIAMTARAMQGDRARCMEAGMDGYVAKPFRHHQLAAEIASIYGGRRPQESPPETPKETSSEVDPPDQAVDFNRDAALSSLGGNLSLLKQVAEAYLGEGPQLMEQMREGIQTRDAKLLERAAHTLKGSSRAIGASSVGRVAERVEKLGAAAKFEEAGGLLAELDAALTRLADELRTL